MWLDFSKFSPVEIEAQLQAPTAVNSEAEKILRFLREWNGGKPDFAASTSGSSGAPKQIRLSKKLALESAARLSEYLGLKEGASALLCLGLEYIAGKMMLVRAIQGKFILYCSSPQIKKLEIPRVDFGAMTSNQVFASPDRIGNIKTLLLGGGPLDSALETQIAAKHASAFQSFGMTETYSQIALRKIGEDGAAYRALKGVALEADSQGRLIVKTEIATENPLITDDIVEMIDAQSFVWKGRYSNTILSGGVKIYPEEIERKIAPQLNMPFFIGGIPNKKYGQTAIFFVEGFANQNELPRINCLIQGLETFQKPREVVFLESFLRTASGKIRRPETLNLFLSDFRG